jgi:hypothetical protein
VQSSSPRLPSSTKAKRCPCLNSPNGTLQLATLQLRPILLVTKTEKTFHAFKNMAKYFPLNERFIFNGRPSSAPESCTTSAITDNGLHTHNAFPGGSSHHESMNFFYTERFFGIFS